MRLYAWAGPVLACLTILTSPARAEEPPRAPTGKWVVSFDAAQCLASRDYGTKESPLTLVFKAPAAGSVIQIAVLREGAAERYAEQFTGMVRVGSAPPRKMSGLSFAPKGKKLRVSLYNLPRAEVAAWPSNEVLTLQLSTGRQVSFALSQFAPMMKVMGECVADLRNHWNYAEGELLSPKLKERASENVASLFTDKDYPRDNISSDEHGAVKVILLVDEQGKVADCTLIETSKVAGLDGQTCAIITTRAKFKPAIGTDGKPARDEQAATIRWAIEEF